MRITTKDGVRLSVREVDSLKRARHILGLLMKHANQDLRTDAELACDWLNAVIGTTDHKLKDK